MLFDALTRPRFPGLAADDELQEHGKVVYVVREPKDALVSLRHGLRSLRSRALEVKLHHFRLENG